MFFLILSEMNGSLHARGIEEPLYRNVSVDMLQSVALLAAELLVQVVEDFCPHNVIFCCNTARLW